jgi:predicted metal-dependent phosphoesterase TrpH
MKIKASLHIHTKEDLKDGYVVKYNIYDLIDYAERHNFKILALTGHKKFIYEPAFDEYAKKKGIILIPAVELNLNQGFLFLNHILVLNCDKEINQVKNFADLEKYKKEHPEIFIIAPHPGFGIMESISVSELIKHIDLFDAVEHSWFYSKSINLNSRSGRAAKKFNKPFIATSDAHILTYFDIDYAVLETDDLSLEGIFKAIKENKFYNITRPKKIYEMIWYILSDLSKRAIKFSLKLIYELFKNKQNRGFGQQKG